MQQEQVPVGPSVEQVAVEKAPPPQRYLLHIALFLLTYASVTYIALAYVSPSTTTEATMYDHLPQAFLFSTLLMLFLTAHEFGHYFAARAYGVSTTLPYYIPFPPSPFGTMGAVIRIRSAIPSRRALFDIGIAGPVAGFIIAFAFLVIGVATMPGIESLYAIHPEYRGMAHLPTGGEYWGGFLLLDFLRNILLPSNHFFPPANEIYHYPLLAVGWFGMFVTSLNMIPAGQLDGGHITYAMFGNRQATIGRWTYRVLLVIGLGAIGRLLLEATRSYHPDGFYEFLRRVFGPPMEWIAANAPWWFDGFTAWLLWALLIRFFFRIAHPPMADTEPLDARRKALGWVFLAIFILIFNYTGIHE